MLTHRPDEHRLILAITSSVLFEDSPTSRHITPRRFETKLVNHHFLSFPHIHGHGVGVNSPFAETQVMLGVESVLFLESGVCGFITPIHYTCN